MSGLTINKTSQEVAATPIQLSRIESLPQALTDHISNYLDYTVENPFLRRQPKNTVTSQKLVSSSWTKQFPVKHLNLHSVAFRTDAEFNRITMPHKDSLVSIDLTQCSAGNTNLQSLATFNKLESIKISHTLDISGEGFTSTQSTCFTNLKKLEINKCFNFSGNDIQHLPKTLTSLAINSSIDNRDLASLSSFENLTSLEIENITLDEQGLSLLAGLKQLTSLTLKRVRIKDDLAALRPLAQLSKLNLSFTNVNDQQLFSLANNLNNLEYLSLNNCRGITNTGIMYLFRLQKLSNLQLKNTSITENGINNLQQKRNTLNREVVLVYLNKEQPIIQNSTVFNSSQANIYQSDGINKLISDYVEALPLNVNDVE